MMDHNGGKPILCIVAAGADSGDARRVRALMAEAGLAHTIVGVDKSQSIISNWKTFHRAGSKGGQIIFLEGTGVIAGLYLILVCVLRIRRQRYIVSSGDSVSAYIGNAKGALFRLLAHAYEKCLYRNAFGFVGWTPYLVGRAYRLGCHRGVTVEGFLLPNFEPSVLSEGLEARKELGIPENNIVVGVTGSINWNERQQYCYGLELISSSKMINRDDISFLVVGGGTGLSRLKDECAADTRFVFTGRQPFAGMARFIKAIDIAVISQTPDELGSLRLTTKLPEYLASGVPVAMSASPASLDYLVTAKGVAGWILPPAHPASPEHAFSLAKLISSITRSDIDQRRALALEISELRFNLPMMANRLNAALDSWCRE